MSEVLIKPLLTDETGQDILAKLDAIVAGLKPHAQGVSFDKTGCEIITTDNVQDALKQLDSGLDDTNASLTQKPNINLNNAYTDNLQIIIALPSITFSSGTGSVSVANYLPSGYTFSAMAFASMRSTSTLSITGAEVDASTNTLTVKCGNSYNGTQNVQVLMFARPN